MLKRKREGEIDTEISRIQDQAIRIKVSRLRARFDNGVQELTAQLKLARGFDRQKMTRRIKQAGSDKSKLDRLESEVQVLKDLNERKIARNYLLKQCIRTKRIAAADAFQSLFAGSRVKPSGSVAEGNVLGRLFKSNPVTEVLPGIMKGIREVVGADKPLDATVGKNADVENTDARRASVELAFGADDEAEEDFEGFSDAFEKESPENLDDELMNIHNSRIAASSEDEAEEGYIRGQDHDRDHDSMEITTDEDDQDSEAELPSSSVSEDEVDVPQSKMQSIKSTPTMSASTSFLPSLMHGGYYSGSDSDGDGAANDGYNPDKAYAASAAKPRNNRRGQRARQAIAVKKHGFKAKHLLKVNGADGVHGDRQRLIGSGNRIATGKERNDGWDAKRGAVESSKTREPRIMRGAKPANRSERRMGAAKGKIGGKSTGANADLIGIKARSGRKEPVGKSGKLHPSWEAARKRKLETANAGPGNFAGKKITFD